MHAARTQKYSPQSRRYEYMRRFISSEFMVIVETGVVAVIEAAVEVMLSVAVQIRKLIESHAIGSNLIIQRQPPPKFIST